MNSCPKYPGPDKGESKEADYDVDEDQLEAEQEEETGEINEPTTNKVF
jgi:hypothetical protein